MKSSKGTSENLVQLSDPQTGEKSIYFEGHFENIKALAMSNDGSQIMSGSSDGSIKIWSVAQRRCIQALICCKLNTEKINGQKRPQVKTKESQQTQNKCSLHSLHNSSDACVTRREQTSYLQQTRISHEHC